MSLAVAAAAALLLSACAPTVRSAALLVGEADAAPAAGAGGGRPAAAEAGAGAAPTSRAGDPAVRAPATDVGPSAEASPGVVEARVQEGVASWYGPKFAGRRTSNGEIFDPSQLTAAHLTLPFGTRVRVTNLDNGRSVVVRINDRGPYKDNRVIDLSRAAAEAIGMMRSGLAHVRLEPLALPDGIVRVAAAPSLHGYEVATPFYPVGQLLLLAPRSGGAPVIVRVVAQDVPSELGADVLVAAALHARLGDTASVHSE